MTKKAVLEKILCEINRGVGLIKCKKCGCMKEALKSLISFLNGLADDEAAVSFLKQSRDWLKNTEPTEYECLGCDYCYPAEAANRLLEAFPEAELPSSVCECKGDAPDNQGSRADFYLLCLDESCPVAVTTLSSTELTRSLAELKPPGLSIAGKLETENIGIVKIVKNILNNPTIRFLIIAGNDTKGHRSGAALWALAENGIDDNGLIIGSPGKNSVLKNVTPAEVGIFRQRVKVIDQRGVDDPKRIAAKIQELLGDLPAAIDYQTASVSRAKINTADFPKIPARPTRKMKKDTAGYFVILPDTETKKITVEHYDYGHRLLHVFEGETAYALYSTLIENAMVSELTHAAYLGKELARAELSLKLGFQYTQE